MKKNRYCFRCLQEIQVLDEAHYGLHRSCFEVWFQNALEPFSNNLELPVFSSLMLKSTDNVSLSASMLTSNFQGRYKKYSAILGTKHYILKVQEDDYPELPATEYLCNQIAELFGIPVPNYYFVQFGINEKNISSFVVENFMTALAGANLKHIYHYFGDLEDGLNCETIIKIIRNNSTEKNDIKTFIETCFFDSLIGNNDRHGRNLGFIETSKGKVLAPIYDNPSYVGIEELFLEYDLEPNGKIATKKINNPSMKDYVNEFKRLGYQKNILDFQKKVNLEKVFSLIQNSFISLKRKDALKKLVVKRFKELTK